MNEAKMQHYKCKLKEVKFSSNDDNDSMTFTGYGAVFGNIDSYGDVIEPGAFANYLSFIKEDQTSLPAMLSQHGASGLTAEDLTPIGSWQELSEDETGLKVKGELANTPRGLEIYQLMKMDPPAINGLSIGYIAKEWELSSKPEEPRRRLKRIDLIEISPVTFPANDEARVNTVKSIHEFDSLSDVEKILRDAGRFSRSEAKVLIAKIKSLNPRDAGSNELAEIAATLTRSKRFKV
ncbi:MAG: HK97 family phage prohead protease [Candidatus Thiodiazotropha lotti]|nr:HK97 family phage prohead protease [Candidatus Thiodiazotropha lotti]